VTSFVTSAPGGSVKNFYFFFVNDAVANNKLERFSLTKIFKDYFNPPLVMTKETL
jgi:hypothetical protein